ncbi:hypothetical protein ACWDTI_17510, partial [Gordonia sp. NPDC003424]
MSPGFTVEEMTEYVEEYLALPHGQKGPWVADKPFSGYQIKKWRKAYLSGDLSRGLVPRQGGGAHAARRAIAAEKDLAAAERAHAAEVATLRERIELLEAGNSALGKAIGLLQQYQQEPGTQAGRP